MLPGEGRYVVGSGTVPAYGAASTTSRAPGPADPKGELPRIVELPVQLTQRAYGVHGMGAVDRLHRQD